MYINRFVLVDICVYQGFHCVKSVRIRSFSSPHFSRSGLNKEICKCPFSVGIGKNTDHKSSHICSYLCHFYAQAQKNKKNSIIQKSQASSFIIYPLFQTLAVRTFLIPSKHTILKNPFLNLLPQKIHF